MKKPSESRFEKHIELALVKHGYQAMYHTAYDKNLCQIPEELIEFIKKTQEEQYDKLFAQFKDNTDAHIGKVVNNQIAKRGLIDVLRNGVSTRGCSFDLVYFQPKSGLNPAHQALYEKNRFVSLRQLHYSNKNNKSIDMGLFLNGIPILTMELKNQLTNQSILDSEKQYRQDRNPKGESLLQFKRCLVHFCVDNDNVSMATRLSGNKTRFLPYNKELENPIVEDDYKTEYLWNDILKPDSLLDIIENFVLVSIEKNKEWSDKYQKVVEEKEEVLIFPRYHQLDVIRKLKKKVVEEGAGHNYLLAHCTGAGKSFSIGWLSHLFTSLYQSKGDTNRIFDTILVVTDRRVLDGQLQHTLKQLEQTEGVVNPVVENANQLKTFLEAGKDIIVTTVQKFPVISKKMKELGGTNFAVIIDEVHSSQSGETAKHLKKSLSPELFEEDEGTVDYEELILREIKARGKQTNVSFFGFTGTPKNKTLELFGRENENGEFVPFHSYTMKQSIHEKFTLDVLAHYTTYKRYFKVVQKVQDDRELPESEAMKQLVDYADSHDEMICQKVSIMLDHFISKTSREIKGKARAMVVLRSRKHCVFFFLQMKKQMKERGLTYSCLVAFSGTIQDESTGLEYTEKSLNKENGMKGKDIADELKDPRFRILIVANKYQTGFDEPLLQTMYVDKKLSSVQCVQTLSRLNRTKTGKVNAFILDFVNEPDDIVNAFQPFYNTTILTEGTDPDKLYDIQYDIEAYGLFTDDHVERFCKELLKKTTTDEKLQPILNEVIKNWWDLEDEHQQFEFKSKIQSFIRLYAYISQIIDFEEVQWEKLYLFLTYLNKKLPKKSSDAIDVTDSIDLGSLRIKMMGESKLVLEDRVGEVVPIYGGSGDIKGNEVSMDLLSHIIERINEVFGIELTQEDKVDLKQVTERLEQNGELSLVMKGDNSESDKMDFYKKLLKGEFTEYYGDRLDFYKKVMNPKIFPVIFEGMYREFNRAIDK